MFEISIIIISILTLIILKYVLNINFNKLKNMEKTEEIEDLKIIEKKLPNQEEMCGEILSLVHNTNVKVKNKPEYGSCLYTIFNNTITLGKFKQNYMKPQTIAHECIHSCQSKTTLWANFIISNIYNVYYFVIVLLTIFNKINNIQLYTAILIFMALIQYIVRFSLENEAMIKAKFLSKEYIEKIKCLNNLEEQILFKEYDRVNNIGIPFTNYYLISTNLIKIIIFQIIILIF